MKLTTHLASVYLLCIILLTPLVFAQSPTVAYRMAYTTLGESTLYIQGGRSSFQFFSLDLTATSWSTSSPPWKELTTINAPPDSSHSLTITADQKSIISWGRSSGISIYDIAGGTWRVITNVQIDPITEQIGLKAITDPRTGIIYTPGAGRGGQMIAYNPSTLVPELLPMPEEFSNYTLAFYSAVWSTTRNSILVYGGYLRISNLRNNKFYEFSPDTRTWSVLSTTGIDPGIKESHCMVSASSGAKMIMFGGETITNRAYRSIFFLDVPTLTWTKGNDAPPGYGQSDMVCTVAGDSFVVWGGNENSQIAPQMGSPIIYNLQSNQWVTQFTLSGTPPTATVSAIPGAPTDPVYPILQTSKQTRPPSTATSQPSNQPDHPPDSGDFGDGNKSNNIIPIIGGSVAVVVVLTIIAFFVYRRSRASSQKTNCNNSSTMDDGSIELNGIPRRLGKGSPSTDSYYSDQESNFTHNGPRSPQLAAYGSPSEQTMSMTTLSNRLSKGSVPQFGEKQEIGPETDYGLLQLDQRMALVKAQFDENQALLAHLDELRSRQSELVDGLRKQMNDNLATLFSI
ncbi:hypothetical protein BGZ76_010235 [Entomortierella beljakovae]|nr:hypothetical protein BGZ76_010235 [Entomortierella beljakovae]